MTKSSLTRTGLAVLVSLSGFSGAFAHEGATDASGCHGRDVATFEHCHVESVDLFDEIATETNFADARRGSRDLTLPECMTCADIAAVQKKLAMFGHSPGPIDGIIGPRTRSAIESYQRANGLSVDGIASETLLARILSDS